MTTSHEPAAQPEEDSEAARTILALARDVGPAKTISPMDAALAVGAADDWQRALPEVRRAAIRLALEGRLVIYRKGKPVDPLEFRGVYRLGLPRDE